MGSSVRVIKIVKDPVSREESYTVEYECIVEDSKQLINELSKNPLGQRAIDLLNQGDFLPEKKEKTAEEIAEEAKAEEEALKKREEELREEGRNEVREKYLEYIKNKRKKSDNEEFENKDKEASEEEVKEEETRALVETGHVQRFEGYRGLLDGR